MREVCVSQAVTLRLESECCVFLASMLYFRPHMLAIVAIGGKQYVVRPGDHIRTEKIAGVEGARIAFDTVLLKGDASTLTVGEPYVKGARVHATIHANGRGERKMVFRYHSKTRYRKKKTHRQDYTELVVEKIA